MTIFLAETLCPISIASKMLGSFDYDNSVGIDAKGRKGGLVLVWTNVLMLNILDVSPSLTVPTFLLLLMMVCLFLFRSFMTILNWNVEMLSGTLLIFMLNILHDHGFWQAILIKFIV